MIFRVHLQRMWRGETSGEASVAEMDTRGGIQKLPPRWQKGATSQKSQSAAFETSVQPHAESNIES
jgi:hypothetical protein